MSELTNYAPPTDVAQTDPTGGRLIAWAEAASAANQLARALSQTAFVPKEMTNVGNATAAILAGDEVGLSPLAALRSIYVVHGTPAFYARTMVALALAHGHQIWTEESSDAKVTVKGRRRGSDHTETAEWTIQRAQKAGYTSNKKYSSNPQEMLYSKAAAEVARKIAADVLAGMPYSVEDLELEDVPTTTVTRSTATTKVARKPKSPEPEPEPEQQAPTATSPSAEPQEPPEDQSIAEAIDPEPDSITSAQQKKMGALMREAGLVDRAVALAFVGETIGREVASRAELTKAEAGRIIDALEADAQTQPTDLGDAPEADEAGFNWPEGGDQS